MFRDWDSSWKLPLSVETASTSILPAGVVSRRIVSSLRHWSENAAIVKPRPDVARSDERSAGAWPGEPEAALNPVADGPRGFARATISANGNSSNPPEYQRPESSCPCAGRRGSDQVPTNENQGGPDRTARFDGRCAAPHRRGFDESYGAERRQPRTGYPHRSDAFAAGRLRSIFGRQRNGLLSKANKIG